MKAEVRVTLHNGQSHYYPDTMLSFAGGRVWTPKDSWAAKDVRMLIVFPVKDQGAVSEVQSNLVGNTTGFKGWGQ